MTTALRILVFVAFACLVLQILLRGSRIKPGAIGRPPIPRPAFFIAKLSLSVSLLLMLLCAIRGGVQLPPALAVVFVCLLLAGAVIMIFACADLGTNLRMGLPEQDTALVTTGLYAFSRNPLYLALFLLLAASVIYAFSWFNAAVAAVAAILHHWIVLAEERYLAGHFAEFEDYRLRVRRYV